MIKFKILVMILCAGLNFIGGAFWHNARRFLMPCVICACVFYLTHSWTSVLTLCAIGFLCLGYGEKSPFRHIFGDAWARFVWMALVSIAFCIGPLFGHHLAWYYALAYVLTNATLGITLRIIPQFLGDSIFGLGFGSIVFLLR